MSRLRMAQVCWLVSCGLAWLPAVAASVPGAPAKAPPDPRIAVQQKIARARSEWQGHSSRLATLLGKLKTQAEALTRLEKDVPALRREIKQRETEKEVELEELRQGMFCSGCGQTRREILAGGDRFPHPGQRSLPATPEQIAAAEKKHDARIEPLRKRLKGLMDERSRTENDLQAALHELTVLIPKYHKAMLDERGHRLDDWRYEKHALEEGLKSLSESVGTAAETTKDTREPEALQFAQANLRILRNQFDSSWKSAQAAHARAEQQASSFASAAQADMERLGRIASALPHKFGLPGGWFLSRRLTGPPMGVSYRVAGVRRFDLPAGAGDVRRLLGEGGAKEAPSRPEPAKKSMKDLLEGN